MENHVADQIRFYRRQEGLTQEQLAEAMGVSVAAVSKWEQGQSLPEIPMLMELADFFDLSVDALLGYRLRSNDRKSVSERLKVLRREDHTDTGTSVPHQPPCVRAQRQLRCCCQPRSFRRSADPVPAVPADREGIDRDFERSVARVKKTRQLMSKGAGEIRGGWKFNVFRQHSRAVRRFQCIHIFVRQRNFIRLLIGIQEGACLILTPNVFHLLLRPSFPRSLQCFSASRPTCFAHERFSFWMSPHEPTLLRGCRRFNRRWR